MFPSVFLDRQTQKQKRKVQNPRSSRLISKWKLQRTRRTRSQSQWLRRTPPLRRRRKIPRRAKRRLGARHLTRRRNGTGTTTTTAGKNATQVLHSTLVTSIINIQHIFSDEEYEWEYIESDEENNQNAKADDKATVTLPTKVQKNPISICYCAPFLRRRVCRTSLRRRQAST